MLQLKNPIIPKIDIKSQAHDLHVRLLWPSNPKKKKTTANQILVQELIHSAFVCLVQSKLMPQQLTATEFELLKEIIQYMTSVTVTNHPIHGVVPRA